MKESSADILNTLRAHRDQLRRLGVRRLSLFGSYARGEQTAESDLDFLVEFERKSFDAYMDLRVFLEGLFQRPVDLATAETIKPGLRDSILAEAIHAA